MPLSLSLCKHSLAKTPRIAVLFLEIRFQRILLGVPARHELCARDVLRQVHDVALVTRPTRTVVAMHSTARERTGLRAIRSKPNQRRVISSTQGIPIRPPFT
jgi:hypothetical protein